MSLSSRRQRLLPPLDFSRLKAVLLLGLALQLAVEQTVAANIEVLTPPAGAKVIARNPTTHLVLRVESGIAEKVQIKAGAAVLKPVVSSEGEELVYLHFKLQLKRGKNRFILEPGAQLLEYNYERIQSDLALKKALTKDASFFHEGGDLDGSCLECHDYGEEDVFEGLSLGNPEGCITCHADIHTQGAWQHSAVMTNKCLNCHLRSTKPWRIGFPTVKTQDLCFSCHASRKKWMSKANIHGPIRFGGCTLCHNPHGSDFRYQLWADGSLDLCILCHSDKGTLLTAGKGKLPYVHAIISGAGCVACHDAHASDHDFILKKPINELCTGCHPKITTRTKGHPVANHPVSAPRERRRPDRQLTCVSCHNPHGSQNQVMLIQTKLGGRLCRVCHKR